MAEGERVSGRERGERKGKRKRKGEVGSWVEKRGEGASKRRR